MRAGSGPVTRSVTLTRHRKSAMGKFSRLAEPYEDWAIYRIKTIGHFECIHGFENNSFVPVALGTTSENTPDNCVGDIVFGPFTICDWGFGQ